MDKFTMFSKTLFKFLESLGYPVYLYNQIPKGAKMPYITIDYSSISIDESTVISGNIWDKSNNRLLVNEIADRLDELIGYGAKVKIGEYGNMILRKGSPFIQPMATDDPTIQNNYFNLELQLYI